MIRIGIIGAGNNATGHGKYYKDSPRAKVTAVADPDLARAQTLADLCGAKAIADYTQFLDQVDAVVISSPNFLHAPQAIACAAAGKHIFCEKPMGLSAADAAQIAAAVTKAGVKSTVGFSVRFTANIQTLIKLHAQNAFGDIISLSSHRLFYMDPAKTPPWRKDHAQSGGLLLEVNVHEIDWMMFLGGAVESVYARSHSATPGPRNNDYLWLTLNFAKGAVATHEGSWITSMPNYSRVLHGTLGGACTDEWGSKLFTAKLGQNREEVNPLSPSFDLRGNFLDCIEKNADPVADVHWGLKVMTVAEAVFRSSASGQVEKIAPLGN